MACTSSPSSQLIPALILLLSLPILLFFIAPHILPPHQITISLPEELDDLSLFHTAIATETTANSTRRTRRLPSAKSRLSTSVHRPKIAFMFLTNSELHFAPIWERFFANVAKEQYNIYIHSDPFVKIPRFEGIFEGKVINNTKRTQRSSPTLISAARRLLATAMIDDKANMYFALISQHCIPLHSFDYFYKFLFDLGRLSKDLELSSYIEILDDQPTLWDRYNARGKDVMVPEVEFEEFRVGSQFFVLNRKHSLMVIKDRKLWRKFKLPCLNVHSCYPEEHYFPTLLSMQDPNKCSHYTLTNVDWTDMVDGHPHTYHPPEVSPELIYRLRKSNSSSYSYMFARKFSPDCLDPLMEIADSVIFKD